MRVHIDRDGVTVHAVSGTYVVHLGFDVSAERRKGLLGFAVYRKDETENDEGWFPNMRAFQGQEGDKNVWPSNEAPVQKFRWGDYTAKPERRYVYDVYPAYGKPGALELGDPLSLTINTEDAYHLAHPDGTVHQVHFSRSGAASQAYVRRFGERDPDEIAGGAALRWLSRGLLEAMVAFIDSAKQNDELCLAVYEIHHRPILDRLKAAANRGVQVKLLYDAGTSKTGPREENQQALSEAGLQPYARPRAGLRSYISHHKFMVLVHDGAPRAVWTGSTNMSSNGIYAQLNVAHVVEDQSVARAYLDLHSALWKDPPAKETRSYLTRLYRQLRPSGNGSNGFIFSPRSNEEAMEYYLELMEGARSYVALTTPFGVDSRIEAFLLASAPKVLKFGLTGTLDRYGGQVTRIDSVDGTRYSMPARIESVLDRWQIEQFHKKSHAYVHTKFLLIDPLGDDPVLVTGSANFSKASCRNNDENMLVIRGHLAAADVYFTEFLRMFEHYAFRQFVDEHRSTRNKLPLDATDHWTDRYFRPGTERQRDRLLFSGSSD